MLWKTILTLGLLITLPACTAMQTPLTSRPAPTKPTLTIQTNPDSTGGFCVDKDNAAELGAYIQALEAAQ
jgi:hypothetical protein